MAKLSLTTLVELHLKPNEVADLFCNMSGDEQAEFFNNIAIISKEWKHPFCFQLQSITDSGLLTEEGRRVMAEIGQYSPPNNTFEKLAVGVHYFNVVTKCDGQTIDEFKSTNPNVSKIGNTFILQKIRDNKLVDIRYLVNEVNTVGNDIEIICSEIPKDS